MQVMNFLQILSENITLTYNIILVHPLYYFVSLLLCIFCFILLNLWYTRNHYYWH